MNSVHKGVVNSVHTQKKDSTKDTHKEAAKAACVFGSFVRLKQEEFESLNEKYGKQLVSEIIDEMNDYCAASRSKGYNDYAAAIRQWIRRRKQAPSGNYRGPQVEGEFKQTLLKSHRNFWHPF